MKAILILLLSAGYLYGQPILPDPKLTPGKSMTNVDIVTLCQPDYTKGVRDVNQAEKNQVYEAYFHKKLIGHFDGEFDHLWPLCLGGSNDPENLWPQSAETGIWNFHTKDRLEDFMYASVRHELKMRGSQSAELLRQEYGHALCQNWTNAYIQYLGEPKLPEVITK